MWPPVSRIADKELAHYAIDKLAQNFNIQMGIEDALQEPGGIRQVVEALYESLSARSIAYALEPYDADQRVQWVRSPETILGGAREGTCLDLALLFAGLALGKRLAPLLVMLDGHAFVAVSLRDTRTTASEMPRRIREPWLDDGVLRDSGTLKKLIDAGDYLPIECTGFAQTKILPADTPESMGRVDGRLAFDAATKAGRAQLDYAPRPFRFAIDLAVLRDHHGHIAYEPLLTGTVSRYRPRLERLMEDDPLFGGRSAELLWLDNTLKESSSGYAFVTGVSGSGKTALLVNWVRRMLALEAQPGRLVQIAYYFISRKYELAEEQGFFELMCQQLQRAHSMHEPLPTDVPGLQAKYLELLARPVPNGSIVVVIDGLDETQGWSPGKLLFPRELPKGMHIVFSAREIANRNWLAMLELDAARVPTLKLKPLTKEAVRDLLQQTSRPLKDTAADDRFVEALHERSAGDPFYLKFLLEDLAKLPAPSVADVQAKPAQLKDYLDQWWEDVAAQGKADKSVRDLLSYLVVALGPIGRDDLVDIDDNDELDSYSVDDAVDAVKRYVIGNDDVGYSLCHPRFHDYLVTDRVRPTDQRPYRQRLTKWCEAAWREPHPRYYAPAHVIEHLAAKRLAEAPTQRGAITAQMLDIVTDRDFMKLKLGGPSGFLGYERDFRAVVGAAATDPLPDTLPQLASAALGLAEARRNAVPVTDLFDAGRDARPELAASQLDVLAPNGDWQRASVLALAWLCATRDKGKARQFLASQRGVLQRDMLSSTLRLMHERTVAAIEGGNPSLELPYYPGKLEVDVAPETARAIVQRMAGSTDHETIAAHLDPSMIRPMPNDLGDETPTYIAEGDSPWLVGYAVTDPFDGEALVRRYIGAHAANPYPVYRNRSLWGVLGAVLCHPMPEWALELARTICEAALQPAAVDYREMLRLATMALAVKLGDTSAAKELDERVAHAQSAARELNPIRHESDSWGFHRRRLAALAESLALTDGNMHTVADLLLQASRLPFGYAGFQAPANLVLADAVFLCQPEQRQIIEDSLESAQRAAHNVQETRFCALTTSRVNAIVRRWRPGAIQDLVATVDRFVADPLASQFAPIHVVGEPYGFRSTGPNSFSIPEESLDASTLAQIAIHAYGMPAAGFSSLNPQIPSDVPLVAGTEVNVLDTGFAPILAARFAAEILARRAELGGVAAGLIATLVPVAAADATTLDLVLGRLLLAAPLKDPVLIKRLAEVAPSDWMRSPVPNRNVEA